MNRAPEKQTDADPADPRARTTTTPGSETASGVVAFRLTGDGFVQAFRSSPAGMLISAVDDGTLLDVNDSFLAMLGYSRDELLGRSAVALGMWARPEQCDRLMTALRERGSIRNVEADLRTKSGELRVGLVSADLVQIDGRPCMFCVCIDITQRRQAEKVLQQERDLITAILDTASALVIVLDPEGRIVRFNSACERCTGYTFEELRGRHFWELLLVPEEVEPARQVFEELRSGQFPNTYENFWVTKSGERRPIAWSNSAMVGESGAVEFVVCTGIDITTRRQAEEALDYRIEFERLITTVSTDFINQPLGNIDHGIDIALGIIGEFAGVDRSYVFLYSTDYQSMSNTHEWCAPDIAPMRDRRQDLPTASLPWFDERLRRLETVYAPRVADLPADAAAEKAEWGFESIQSLICVPMVCAGALIGFVGFDSVRSQKDWPDDIVALLRIVGDIFASALTRKQAEEALRESEERFRTLFQATFEAVVIHARGVILDTNQAFEKMLGYERSEAIGTAVTEFVAPESRELVLAKIRAGAREPYESRALTKDGRTIDVEVVARDHTYQGQAVRVTALRDITERKRAEQALQRAERLAGLGTMVAGVAHELNNPLMAISGLSELLAKNADPDSKTAQLAEEISAQSIRCGRIVKDLLGFARASPVRRTAVQVNDLIRRCLERARHDARFQDVDIAEDLSPDIPPTMADPYRLEQVFINIIRNAGDALAGDRPAKRFEVCTRLSHGEIRVDFVDNGPGIEEPDKIFDPFYSTRATGEGTGLGLSVSFGIVEEHGGRITARNLATGACISVQLPIHPAPAR
ncbi:MAG: PAS domain S-box protein [Planctomycetes bacterium]|nr:PAS domain S-box protein [Planctomycetota bacterium]